jgi:crossover junction endodeoxyribonuclease RuvC
MTKPPEFCLGIDPGLAGALALLRTSDLSIVNIFDMPTLDGRVNPAELAAIVDMFCTVSGGNKNVHAAVELVSSMPRQAGAFNFGVSAGVVHGVLGALGIPMILVPPGIWKPACGLRRGINEKQAENKTRARELATRLWPERTSEFSKVKFDGRAEACLLARYFVTKNNWRQNENTCMESSHVHPRPTRLR